ncbi:methionine adenosyltransferase [Streptomyces virginiae]
MTILERKGLGHPDTLADHLAEALSREYANWTLEHAGAVLHHNFDKLTMHGGAVHVTYGGGRVLAPIKIMVNGRVTRRCGEVAVPVEQIVRDTITEFFAERVPVFADHLDVQFNLTSNSSPGAVHTGADGDTERGVWFDLQSIDQLRERHRLISNDTSMGTGFAPLTPLEAFARELVDELSGPSAFTAAHPWCGTDVKMMLVGDAESFDAVLCVPQVSAHVASREEYLANRAKVAEYCRARAAEALGEEVAAAATFRINARDIDDRDELYLTLSGTSLESGDEGVVGRGNRANGLITPLRPINLEGVSGKNPVYHVGKLYNLAAEDIAAGLARQFGCHAQVTLISATGQDLAYPWKVFIRTSVPVDTEQVRKAVLGVTTGFPALTESILAGKRTMA